MKVYQFPNGKSPGVYVHLISDLMEAPVIHTGEWQSLNTSASRMHGTHELEDVSLVWDRLPGDLDEIIPHVDQSWADDHYLERVSGIAYNPAPSHLNWPYAVRGNALHTDAANTFDHTYPERFWPKHARHFHPANWDQETIDANCGGYNGIRFNYGDLGDVVNMLVKSPLTRQAFLPVWFPEDTGAVDGQRVPCTLGYHFMIRNGRLTTRYYMRSCDVYRHMSNDIWLSAMLARWVVQQVNVKAAQDSRWDPSWQPLELGGMLMHISSLHMFEADRAKMQMRMGTA